MLGGMLRLDHRPSAVALLPALALIPALAVAAPVSAAPHDLADEPGEPQAIFAGQEVERCGWPTAVAVVGGSSLCTGTLVHPRVVVYAAHCGGGNKTIDFGELVQAPGQFVKAETCQTYPGYAGVNDQAHDWAFCRLPYAITDLPVTPVLFGCETQQISAGTQVAIAGFGANSGNSGAGTKRWGMTTLTGVFGGTATLGGGGKPSVCPGDSGGPAYVQLADGGWRAFGIASTVTGSCGGTGTHALIHQAVPWIEQTSGIDITPCHDLNGNWDPDYRCSGFSMTGSSGFGNWPKWCEGTPKTGAATTCGQPFDALPDNEPPQVAITYPPDGAKFEVPGAPIDVEIAADDGDGWGLVAVRLVINGDEQAKPDLDAPYGFAGVQFPTGVWTIAAVAEDAAGLISVSDPVTIIVGDPPQGSTGGETGSTGDPTTGDPTTGDPTGTLTSGDASAGGGGSSGTGATTNTSADFEGDEDQGCGCRSGEPRAGALGGLVLLGLALRRRRRRSR